MNIDWRRLLFWQKKHPDEPQCDVLTEMAEIMQVCQIEGAVPILFLLRGDAMAALNEKSDELTHGLFGAEHHQKLSAIKKVFGVPVAMSREMLGVGKRVLVWAILGGEARVYSNASVISLKHQKDT